MDAVAEIKARIPIEELVANYVQLKKSGRTFKALCPFHSERTPSFYVSPERQMAYCFGCHKGGDHFAFIQEIEGLDFKGALAMLAERAGVTLPTFRPEYKEHKTQRDRLVQLHEKASEYFEEQLFLSEAGKKVLEYLTRRGLTEETIKNAHLGFAPDSWDSLYSYLIKQDFTREEMLLSGLVLARDTGQESYVDRFRMRLMFPIYNVMGAICAFGGRALKDGDQPKYLNSPETPIFHKSSFLYGLHEARAAIRNKKVAVLVEGYMDALAAHQAGVKNAVACGGTALTEEQLLLLKRFAKNLTLSFDRDEAGMRATERAIELALPQGFSISVVQWEGSAKDPDECARENPEAFMKSIESPMPTQDYLLSYYTKQFPVTTTQGKKQAVEALLPFLHRIQSPVELDEWLKKCAASLTISLSSLYDELKRFQGKQKASSPVHSRRDAPTSPNSLQLTKEEYLIGLLLTYKEARGVVSQLLTPQNFSEIPLQNIYRYITTHYNQSLGADSREALTAELSEDEVKKVDLLSIFIESAFADAKWATVEKEVIETARALIRMKFDQEKREVISKLKTSESTNNIQLLEAYQRLLAEEKRLTTDNPTP